MKELADEHKPNIEDEEDEVEASAAPLLEHLNELRVRLMWSIGALAVAAGICFAFAPQIYNFLVEPYAAASVDIRGEEAPPIGFVYLGPLEFFFAKLKLALFAGVFLASPVLAYQIYAFVAPGLYKNERGAFLPFLIAAPSLFAAGAAFVYYVMIPLVARFALGQEQMGSDAAVAIQHLPSVAAYLSLIMALMLAFGISFQLPVVMSLLGKAGIIGADTLRKGRKYALVGVLAFAAFFTPPDVISQIMLTVPVMMLYEAGIWCVVLIERGQAKRDAEEVFE